MKKILKLGAFAILLVSQISWSANSSIKCDADFVYENVIHNEINQIKEFIKKCKNFDLSALMLPTGADKDSAITPLILASAAGHIDMVKLLLNHGVDPDVQRPTGNTVLFLISTIISQYADPQYPQIVEILLNHGADTNIQNNDKETALIAVSRFPFEHTAKTLKLLLEHGAKPNIQGDEGITALMYSSYSGHVKNVKMLLKYKANPHIKSQSSHWKGKKAIDLAKESKARQQQGVDPKNLDKVIKILEKAMKQTP